MHINFQGSSLSISVKKLLKTIGDLEIKKLTVARIPLSKGLNFLLNLVSNGEYEKRKSELSYDDIFHLYLVIETSKGAYILEKNEVIYLARFKGFKPKTETIDINRISGLTLHILLAKTKAMMEQNFYSYNAKANNCQTFIYSIIKSNGMMTNEVKDFILQDTEYLFKNNPRFRKLTNNVTDTGAVLSRVKEVYNEIRSNPLSLLPHNTLFKTIEEKIKELPQTMFL